MKLTPSGAITAQPSSVRSLRVTAANSSTCDARSATSSLLRNTKLPAAPTTPPTWTTAAATQSSCRSSTRANANWVFHRLDLL
eukprot:6177373-Pleurochrysis_carterae.AAC.5